MTATPPRAAHIVIDLETLDVRSSALVLSIGAVAMTAEGLFQHPGFHTVLDRQEQASYRSVDAGTVSWWDGQSPEARRACGLDRGTSVWPVPALEALQQFTEWVESMADPETVRVWGNGASFDNVILRSLYEANRMPPPWHWRHDRDLRTALDLAPAAKQVDFEGIKHHALHDALHEARQLCIALQALPATA